MKLTALHFSIYILLLHIIFVLCLFCTHLTKFSRYCTIAYQQIKLNVSTTKIIHNMIMFKWTRSLSNASRLHCLGLQWSSYNWNQWATQQSRPEWLKEKASISNNISTKSHFSEFLRLTFHGLIFFCIHNFGMFVLCFACCPVTISDSLIN